MDPSSLYFFILKSCIDLYTFLPEFWKITIKIEKNMLWQIKCDSLKFMILWPILSNYLKFWQITIEIENNMILCQIMSYLSKLGTGQNLSGTRAGTIDRGRRIFFTTKSENPRFHVSKKSHFWRSKSNLCVSSVLIGVWYIQQIHWVVFMTLGEAVFGRNKKGGRRVFFEEN